MRKGSNCSLIKLFSPQSIDTWHVIANAGSRYRTLIGKRTARRAMSQPVDDFRLYQILADLHEWRSKCQMWVKSFDEVRNRETFSHKVEVF